MREALCLPTRQNPSRIRCRRSPDPVLTPTREAFPFLGNGNASRIRISGTETLPGAGSAAHVTQLALNLARHIPLLDRVALVPEVLAARQRDLDLGVRALAGEIQPRRLQCEAALVERNRELLDLVAVHQQLA